MIPRIIIIVLSREDFLRYDQTSAFSGTSQRFRDETVVWPRR